MYNYFRKIDIGIDKGNYQSYRNKNTFLKRDYLIEQ